MDQEVALLRESKQAKLAWLRLVTFKLLGSMHIAHSIHGTNGIFLPTWMVEFYGKCRCKYTSPMDAMGGIYYWQFCDCDHFWDAYPWHFQRLSEHTSFMDPSWAMNFCNGKNMPIPFFNSCVHPTVIWDQSRLRMINNLDSLKVLFLRIVIPSDSSPSNHHLGWYVFSLFQGILYKQHPR